MLTRIYTQVHELSIAKPKTRKVLERVYAGKASPREAIKAQCLICREHERRPITDCKELGCALWMYRPYQEEA